MHCCCCGCWCGGGGCCCWCSSCGCARWHLYLEASAATRDGATGFRSQGKEIFFFLLREEPFLLNGSGKRSSDLRARRPLAPASESSLNLSPMQNMPHNLHGIPLDSFIQQLSWLFFSSKYCVQDPIKRERERAWDAGKSGIKKESVEFFFSAPALGRCLREQQLPKVPRKISLGNIFFWKDCAWWIVDFVLLFLPFEDRSSQKLIAIL